MADIFGTIKYNTLQIGAAYSKTWSGATTAPDHTNAVLLVGPEAGRLYWDVAYNNGSAITRRLYCRTYHCNESEAGSVSSGTTFDVGDSMAKTVVMQVNDGYLQVYLSDNLVAGETMIVRVHLERTRFGA